MNGLCIFCGLAFNGKHDCREAFAQLKNQLLACHFEPPEPRPEPKANTFIDEWRYVQLLKVADDFVDYYKRNVVAFPLTDFYERIKIILDGKK